MLGPLASDPQQYNSLDLLPLYRSPLLSCLSIGSNALLLPTAMGVCKANTTQPSHVANNDSASSRRVAMSSTAARQILAAEESLERC